MVSWVELKHHIWFLFFLPKIYIFGRMSFVDQSCWIDLYIDVDYREKLSSDEEDIEYCSRYIHIYIYIYIPWSGIRASVNVSNEGSIWRRRWLRASGNGWGSSSKSHLPWRQRRWKIKVRDDFSEFVPMFIRNYSFEMICLWRGLCKTISCEHCITFL